MAVSKILAKLEETDIRSLQPLQRILLVTDGTLTEILEAYFLEPIQLVKLSQQIVDAAASPIEFAPKDKEKFLERKILLRGANSGKNYVYAESTIAFERLNSRLRDEMLDSDTPLGRLWLNHRLETFKELTDVHRRSANDLCVHFGCAASSRLFARTYRVIAESRPVMMISEYFPAE